MRIVTSTAGPLPSTNRARTPYLALRRPSRVERVFRQQRRNRIHESPTDSGNDFSNPSAGKLLLRLVRRIGVGWKAQSLRLWRPKSQCQHSVCEQKPTGDRWFLSVCYPKTVLATLHGLTSGGGPNRRGGAPSGRARRTGAATAVASGRGPGLSQPNPSRRAHGHGRCGPLRPPGARPGATNELGERAAGFRRSGRRPLAM